MLRAPEGLLLALLLTGAGATEPVAEASGARAGEQPAELREAAEALPQPARWRGGILFDEPVRQRLRAASPQLRARAASASDVLLRLCLAFPLATCVLHLSLLRRRLSRETVARLLAAGVLALSLTGMVHAGVSRGVGRERPYAQGCAAPAPPPECGQGAGAARLSFYSGHTAAAFTTLGLVVLQVRSLGLRGTWVGGALQGLATLAAVAMGLLRMVSDRHYVSDVLTGAAMGLGTALLLGRLCGVGLRAADRVASPARAREAAGRLPAPSSGPEGD